MFPPYCTTNLHNERQRRWIRDDDDEIAAAHAKNDFEEHGSRDRQCIDGAEGQHAGIEPRGAGWPLRSPIRVAARAHPGPRTSAGWRLRRSGIRSPVPRLCRSENSLSTSPQDNKAPRRSRDVSPRGLEPFRRPARRFVERVRQLAADLTRVREIERVFRQHVVQTE